MKISTVENNLEFQDIFLLLQQSKNIAEEFRNLNKQEDNLSERRKKLYEPFYQCTLNVEKYKQFFKKYYISAYNSEGKYIVKDIHLTKDYENSQFYEVSYHYIGKDEKKDGEISLRKFIRMLDNPYFELKEYEKERII